MCGIIGILNTVHARRELEQGLLTIQNRGKDGQQTVFVPNGAFGHCLHAVVSKVPQPFQKKGVFLANCEIYNWKELAKKHGLKPRNDAELLFQLLEKKPFAKYWIHAGTISYKNAKMSKSLGNLILVSDLLKTYSANAIRWMLLSHHYRDSWEFTDSEIKKADVNMKTVQEYIEKTQASESENKETLRQFAKFMDNDLQTPEALSYILKLVQDSSGNKKSVKKILQILGFILMTG